MIKPWDGWEGCSTDGAGSPRSAETERPRKAKSQQPDSRVKDSLSKLGRHHRRENLTGQGECHKSPMGQFPRRTGRGPPTSPSHRTWDVAGASWNLGTSEQERVSVYKLPKVQGLWAPI